MQWDIALVINVHLCEIRLSRDVEPCSNNCPIDMFPVGLLIRGNEVHVTHVPSSVPSRPDI